MNKQIRPLENFVRNLLLVPLVLICGGAQVLLADQELIRFPSGPATWTVSCVKNRGGKIQDQPTTPEPAMGVTATPQEQTRRNPEENQTDVFPKKIDVAQNDTIARSIIHLSNGRKQELWWEPRLSVILTEDPSGQAFVTRETFLYGDPFGPSNFDWIKRESLVGEKPVKFGGLECFHYKGVMLVPDLMGMGKPQTIVCEAWVDSQTLLPVALMKDDLLGRFAFGAPPENLKIPQKFADRLTYYKITMGMQ